MKYNLVYTRRAERDIRKLEPNTRERIGKTLLRYAEDPLRFAEKLSDPILGNIAFGLVTTGLFLTLKRMKLLF